MDVCSQANSSSSSALALSELTMSDFSNVKVIRAFEGEKAFLGSGRSGNVWVGDVDGLPAAIKVGF